MALLKSIRNIGALAQFRTNLIFRHCSPNNKSIYQSNFIDVGSIRYIIKTDKAFSSFAETTATKPEPEITEKELEATAAKKNESEVEREFHSQIIKLKEENHAFLVEIKELKDKYQRALADRENVRTRLEKQITDAKLYGIQQFCKDLLEVSDIFHKAIESIPKEAVEKEDEHFMNLYSGIVMTENHLLNVFKRHGLSQIKPNLGDKFDPSVQEAMFQVPTEKQDVGNVAAIVRTGWMLHERCIRSAQVGVYGS